MLEAVHTDLVSSSAWSAAPKIFSYPQAGRPITPYCVAVQHVAKCQEETSSPQAKQCCWSTASWTILPRAGTLVLC